MRFGVELVQIQRVVMARGVTDWRKIASQTLARECATAMEWVFVSWNVSL